MRLNKTLKKFGFRLLVVVVVFLCIRLTTDSANDQHSFFDTESLFYFITAFIFFIVTWEFNDWLIKRHLNKRSHHWLDWSAGLRILGKTLLLILPLCALVYYVAIFHFADSLNIVADDPWLQVRSDFFRGGLLAITVIVFNLFYFSGQVKKTLESKVTEMQKELLVTKYQSLKAQISPHFLFNSLNTLTALMYEDRDLASDFVIRLSSCYRYILDNREADLVRLDKELSFLDSFIFMMEVRHRNSVQIETEIAADAREYLIPTLSLQMLVENALKHNYYSDEHPLLIVIRVTSQALVVENTLRKRKETQESTRLGIDNIKKRYSHYTSKQVKLNQENNTYSVTLPLLKNDAIQKTSLQIIL